MKSLKRMMLFFLVAVCLVAQGQADDWSQFRGPHGLGVSSETLPTTWNGNQGVVWSLDLPGAGSSSPITLAGKLYVTSYSGYGTGQDSDGELSDLKLHLSCYDQASGKHLWTTDIEPKQPESERVRDHGYAAATPVTDGERIYTFFGKTGVIAFDLSGKKLWQSSVGDGLHGWGCGTSPVLFENLVIVNASVESKSLVALDKQTGKEVWRADGITRSWSTPHLVALPNGNTELALSIQQKILGFDPRTGEQLWSCEGIQDYVCPSVISHQGVVYCIGGRQSRAIAVKAGGRGDVTDTHRLWEAQAGANVSSPVIVGDYMYWVSDRTNAAFCLRLSDGELMYRERVKGQPYASTVAAGNHLYVVTRRGGTLVLKASPEYTLVSTNKLDDSTQFNASPAVAGGCLYLRSDSKLYCIGSRS